MNFRWKACIFFEVKSWVTPSATKVWGFCSINFWVKWLFMWIFVELRKNIKKYVFPRKKVIVLDIFSSRVVQKPLSSLKNEHEHHQDIVVGNHEVTPGVLVVKNGTWWWVTDNRCCVDMVFYFSETKGGFCPVWGGARLLFISICVCIYLVCICIYVYIDWWMLVLNLINPIYRCRILWEENRVKPCLALL